MKKKLWIIQYSYCKNELGCNSGNYRIGVFSNEQIANHVADDWKNKLQKKKYKYGPMIGILNVTGMLR